MGEVVDAFLMSRLDERENEARNEDRDDECREFKESIGKLNRHPVGKKSGGGHARDSLCRLMPNDRAKFTFDDLLKNGPAHEVEQEEEKEIGKPFAARRIVMQRERFLSFIHLKPFEWRKPARQKAHFENGLPGSEDVPPVEFGVVKILKRGDRLMCNEHSFGRDAAPSGFSEMRGHGAFGKKGATTSARGLVDSRPALLIA
jgi:hypothetical protein